MKMFLGLGIALSGCLISGFASSAPRVIDSDRSVMTIRVYKAGLFSFAAHDHVIEARGAQGAIETSDQPGVELRIDTRRIRVLDPQLSADKRADVQKTMEGPKVLDIQRYPEIRFRSTSVVSTGPGAWQVAGELTLHGQSRPVSLEVRERNGGYTGRVSLRQTEFGIQPVSLFGGTVKVKNEISIDFEIYAAK